MQATFLRRLKNTQEGYKRAERARRGGRGEWGVVVWWLGWVVIMISNMQSEVGGAGQSLKKSILWNAVEPGDPYDIKK